MKGVFHFKKGNCQLVINRSTKLNLATSLNPPRIAKHLVCTSSLFDEWLTTYKECSSLSYL